MALVAATFRQAPGTAAAIVLFVTLHAGLHMLAVWREAASRPVPSILRALDARAAGMMLAVTLPVIVLGATGPRPVITSAWLLAGAICQLCSLHRVSQRLRHVLLAIGSVLQFIAVALLALADERRTAQASPRAHHCRRTALHRAAPVRLAAARTAAAPPGSAGHPRQHRTGGRSHRHAEALAAGERGRAGLRTHRNPACKAGRQGKGR
ncbi:hypothetical protein G6F24_014038 [Rhizopus arrhizus]|nr:hypothetical protein G6F24_014038 [Rhizopus arrhizus]